MTNLLSGKSPQVRAVACPDASPATFLYCAFCFAFHGRVFICLYALPFNWLFSAPRIAPNECLFCPSAHADTAACLAHMQKAHSFTIPYVQHCEDCEGDVTSLEMFTHVWRCFSQRCEIGLLTYLAEKIAIGGMCIQVHVAAREQSCHRRSLVSRSRSALPSRNCSVIAALVI
jgi:hypothetical protein